MNFFLQGLGLVFTLNLFFFFSSCTPKNTITYTNDPRQVLIGKVIQNDSSVAKNAIVSLFEVKLTTKYDSICNTYSTTTTENGCFLLKNVPDGNYFLYVYDTALGRCNLSRIQKNQMAYQLDSIIVLRSLITMKGRIVGLNQNCTFKQILIPGFGASAHCDDNGVFVLSDVPSGNYDLVIIGSRSTDYVKMNVLKTFQDTFFLQDIDVCSSTPNQPVSSDSD